MFRNLKLTPKTLSILCVFSMLACAGGENATSENGADANGDRSNSWILGEWEGMYKNTEASEGSSLRETAVEAHFVSTKDTAGTFEIKLPRVHNAYAKGTYRDFAGKNLFLDIEASTISAIGLAGNQTEFAYELIGDDLKLNNNRITLMLLRKKKQDSAAEGSPDKNQPLLGYWECTDPSKRKWQLQLKDQQSFALIIVESGKQSLLQNGKAVLLKSNEEQKAYLTVETSRNSSYIGDAYALKLVDEKNSVFSRLNRNSTPDNFIVNESFPCNRPK